MELVEVYRAETPEQLEWAKKIEALLRERGFTLPQYEDAFPSIDRKQWTKRIRVPEDQAESAKELILKLRGNKWVDMPKATEQESGTENWLERLVR